MKRIRLILFLLILVPLLAGCDSLLTGVDPLSGQQQPSANGPTPTSVALTATPDFYGVVSDQDLYALAAGTGKVLWHNHLSGADTGYTPQPVVSGNVVYLEDGKTLDAFDIHSGKTLWRFNFASYLSIPGPVNFLIGQKAVYLVTFDGQFATAGPQYVQDSLIQRTPSTLISINITSGTLNWHKQLGYDLSEPVIDGDTIYGLGSTTMSGALYALNGSDGSQLWQQPFAQTSTYYGAFVIDSGTLYFGKVDALDAAQGAVYAFSLDNGQEIWKNSQIPSNVTSVITVAEGTLYFSVGADAFYALKAQDGSLLWSHPFPSLTTNIVANGQVYLFTQPASTSTSNQPPPTQPTTLHVLNASTGSLAWSRLAPLGTVTGFFSHQTLYVFAYNNATRISSFTAFDPATGKPGLTYPLPSDSNGEYTMTAAS